MSAMLQTVWPLRDVADVEALCRGVLREQTRMRGAGSHQAYRPADGGPSRLTQAEFEDSLRHLLGQVVIEERKFVAKGFDRRPGYLFRPWLYVQLRSRLIDYWRSPAMFGRQGQHRVGDPAAGLAARVDEAGFDDRDAGEDRLDGPVTGGALDDLDDRLATGGGLLSVGDREEDGTVRGAGPGGDRANGRGPARADRRPAAGAAGADRGLAPPFLDCLSCGWRTYRQAPNGKPGWHYPEACPSCSASLASPVAA